MGDFSQVSSAKIFSSWQERQTEPLILEAGEGLGKTVSICQISSVKKGSRRFNPIGIERHLYYEHWHKKHLKDRRFL